MIAPSRAKLGGSPLGCALGLALVLAQGAAPAGAGERVDLQPERAAGGAARWLAALRAHEPRLVRVDTSPSGAELELAYVRDGVQLRRARGRAPLEIVLPGRASAGDSVSISAQLSGRRTTELTLPAEQVHAALTLELPPLPNQIVAAWLLELGGRARLTLLSPEPLAARIDPTPRGWRVVATDTALGEGAAAALSAARGRAVERIEARALGADLLLELDARPARAAGAELRTSSEPELVRPLHRYALDLVAADGAAAQAALREALATLSPSDVTGCAAAFDEALRAALAPDALARALSPASGPAQLLISQTLVRLAELSPDASLHLLDGTIAAPERPVERARALAQLEQVRGLLAALRGAIAHLAPVESAGSRARTLGAVIAPELSAGELDAALARAEGAERACASASR